MALTGVHIACGYISVASGAALLGAQAWSRTMANAGTTDVGATTPTLSSAGFTSSLLGFEVTASFDIWVAWGKNPDASQVSGTDATSRILVHAGETRNVFCAQGDKVAWIAA